MNPIMYEQLVAANQLDIQRGLARRERSIAKDGSIVSGRSPFGAVVRAFSKLASGRSTKLGNEYEGQPS
ncbi:MAG: hypothetical protein ACJ789_09365 [Thermomicrobiales bacterium]